ncbi:MAG: hypothetical protein M2R45_04493 [Verrucomicrobia subdivision 3 bacterium]|nr:hypothetical protein [Limisphaerales bacterium]MCS1412663.1 hypothetical protein [Limisphaerales bacterium]
MDVARNLELERKAKLGDKIIVEMPPSSEMRGGIIICPGISWIGRSPSRAARCGSNSGGYIFTGGEAEPSIVMAMTGYEVARSVRSDVVIDLG